MVILTRIYWVWKTRYNHPLCLILLTSLTALGESDGDYEDYLFLSGSHLLWALPVLFHLTLQTLKGSRAGQLNNNPRHSSPVHQSSRGIKQH